GRFDAEDEPVVGVVEVAGAGRRGEADPAAVGEVEQCLQVERLPDEPVAVVDRQRAEPAVVDVGEHPVPCGPLAVLLPRRLAVVHVDAVGLRVADAFGDRPAELLAEGAAVAVFLVVHFGGVAVAGVGQAAVDPRADGLSHIQRAVASAIITPMPWGDFGSLSPWATTRAPMASCRARLMHSLEVTSCRARKLPPKGSSPASSAPAAARSSSVLRLSAMPFSLVVTLW